MAALPVSGVNPSNVQLCALIWDCGYDMQECRSRIDALKQEEPSITEAEIRAGLHLARDWQDQRNADKRYTGGAYVNVAAEVQGSQHDWAMLGRRNLLACKESHGRMHTAVDRSAGERAKPVDPGSSPGDSTSSAQPPAAKLAATEVGGVRF